MTNEDDFYRGDTNDSDEGSGDEYGSVPLIDARAFEQVSAEPIDSLLDVDSWSTEPDLAGLISKIEGEVAEAVRHENEDAANIRRLVFPRIADPGRPNAAPGCGVFSAAPRDLRQVWSQVLFNGGIDACDATLKAVSTLPLSVTQIGVCLASYQGDQQSYAHRVFQRDVHGRSGDALNDALALLDRRKQRGAGKASQLLLRGVMTYAERAVLAYKSSAPWRMGHGQPAPYEILTGSGLVDHANMPLLAASFQALTYLVDEHRKFVFVPSSAADERLLTVGNALRPCEYIIFNTAYPDMHEITRLGRYNPTMAQVADSFAELGKQIAVGVYRASEFAPPRLFYSHIDHSHEAALIALADSLLQEHRGFPLLIDLADRLCQSAFGNDILDGALQSAFARAKAPFRYLGERSTRN